MIDLDPDPVMFVIVTMAGAVMAGGLGGWLAGALALWLIRRENH